MEKKSENMDYIMLIPPTTYNVCGGFFVHCAVACSICECELVDRAVPSELSGKIVAI